MANTEARISPAFEKKHHGHLVKTDKSYKGTPLEFEGFDNPVYPWLIKGTNLLYAKEIDGMDDETNPFLQWKNGFLINLAEKIHPGKIDVIAKGEMPFEGPGLFAATHPGTESSLIGPWAVMQEVNRPTQVIAKDVLIYPWHRESPEVLARTGKEEKLKDRVLNVLMCLPTRAANSIPLERGGHSGATNKNVNGVLARGGLVLTFPKGTRAPENDFSEMMDGIGTIIRWNKRKKVYPMVLTEAVRDPNSGYTSSVIIGEPFTYADVPFSNISKPRDEDAQITRFLVGRMVDLYTEMNPDKEVILVSQDPALKTTIVDFGKKG